jgi:tetratricopeptide (TPR) repeat protein
MDMDQKSQRFKHFDYQIVSNEADADGPEISEEIRTLLEETYKKIQRKKNSVLKELNDLIRKYPKVPQFKNQLSVFYAQQGNMKKAYDVNELILQEHPDYLFGKLNLVVTYLSAKDYEKIPAVLGESMEIKELYPHRNIFHINEVASFYQITILYFLGIGNLEAAESRLEVLNELPEDIFTNKNELSNQVSEARFKFNLDRIKQERDKRPKKTIIKRKFISFLLSNIFKFITW